MAVAHRIRRGVVVPNVGAFADVAAIAELARDAEAAGWDGFFIWDTIEYEDKAVVDPWIALAACAASTRRIALGPMVASAARRRPWKLAREALSLDQLSRGRLILGLGAGDGESGFTAFGESADPRTKAAKFDETIELLRRFLSGRPVSFHGSHYRVESRAFRPAPIRGYIPLWIAANDAGARYAMERAARVDGILGGVSSENAAHVLAFVQRHRSSPVGFDVVVGVHRRQDADTAREFERVSAAAGATWIRYEIGPILDSVDDIAGAREFVRRGPLSG